MMQRFAFFLLLICSFFTIPAWSAPTMAVQPTDTDKMTVQDTKTQEAQETQNVSQENLSNQNATNTSKLQDVGIPSIEEIAAPNDGSLSHANAELLIKNAELERRVNDLTTQVNVLTHERSGQLYLYGAMTVLITIGLCMLAGTFISMRGQRSRW